MHPEVTQVGSLSEGRIRGSNGRWRQEMMSQLWSARAPPAQIKSHALVAGK